MTGSFSWHVLGCCRQWVGAGCRASTRCRNSLVGSVGRLQVAPGPVHQVAQDRDERDAARSQRVAHADRRPGIARIDEVGCNAMSLFRLDASIRVDGSASREIAWPAPGPGQFGAWLLRADDAACHAWDP